MNSHPPATTDRRLRKYFAAFAHNLRHATAAPVFTGVQVNVLSDRCVVVQPAPGMRSFLIEPGFIAGPSGIECFIRCRMALPGDADPNDPLPLVAVWRCTPDGVVSAHPESGARPLGYLCDSAVAMSVLARLVTLEAHTNPERASLFLESARWGR